MGQPVNSYFVIYLLVYDAVRLKRRCKTRVFFP